MFEYASDETCSNDGTSGDSRRRGVGLCQHLCAHIGSVGFVYLLHLSCVPPS